MQDLSYGQTTVLHLGMSEKGRTHEEVPVDCFTTGDPYVVQLKEGTDWEVGFEFCHYCS